MGEDRRRNIQNAGTVEIVSLRDLRSHGDYEGVRPVITGVIGRESVSWLRAAHDPVFFRQQLSGYLGVLVPVYNDIRHVTSTGTVVNVIRLVNRLRC